MISEVTFERKKYNSSEGAKTTAAMFCKFTIRFQNNQKLFLYEIRGTPALHLNELAGGSCCDAGLGLVWRCYCIYMTFVCLIKKNILYFELLRGRGCVESKNMQKENPL